MTGLGGYMKDATGQRLDAVSIPNLVVVRGPGIDPTGATDSTTAIQSLVNAAGTGAHIFFPAGTFLAAGLAPKSGQRWHGPGILKRLTGSADLLQINGLTDVTIDLTMDGGWTTTLTGNPGPGLQPVANAVNIFGSSSYIKVRGKISNIQGSAVRVYDSSRCDISVNIYNAYYGVLITSGGVTNDPSGGSHRNAIHDCDINTVAKNAIYLTGNSSSGSGPNVQRYNRVSDVHLSFFGDTAIEIGQGSHDTSVTNVIVDGGDTTARLNGWAFNGILVRDAKRTSVTGCTIRNIPSYTNGNGHYLTLGNGIYLWPQFTGDLADTTISNVAVYNCTRGVFLQGNNTVADTTASGISGGAGTVTFADGVTTSGSPTLTSATAKFLSSDVGKAISGPGIPAASYVGVVNSATSIGLSSAAGSNTPVNATATATGVTFGIFGRQVWSAVSLSNIVVNGTQLGVLDGSWAGFQAAINSHGFYIQSASGVTLSNCVAHDCQNDGFRIGDTAASSSYATDVTATGCRSHNNGQQQVAGQSYYGFNLNGTSNQNAISLVNCTASDFQPTGAKTQATGFIWNGAGNGQTANVSLIGCAGRGNSTGTFNNCGPAPVFAGNITLSAGNVTAGPADAVIVYNGTGGHTITLPSAIFAGSGRSVLVRNLGTGSVTIARSGAATLWVTSLAAGADHYFVTDGASNWF